LFAVGAQSRQSIAVDPSDLAAGGNRTVRLGGTENVAALRDGGTVHLAGAPRFAAGLRRRQQHATGSRQCKPGRNRISKLRELAGWNAANDAVHSHRHEFHQHGCDLVGIASERRIDQRDWAVHRSADRARPAGKRHDHGNFPSRYDQDRSGHGDHYTHDRPRNLPDDYRHCD